MFISKLGMGRQEQRTTPSKRRPGIRSKQHLPFCSHLPEMPESTMALTKNWPRSSLQVDSSGGFCSYLHSPIFGWKHQIQRPAPPFPHHVTSCGSLHLSGGTYFESLKWWDPRQACARYMFDYFKH